QEGVRDLYQDARAVAGERVAAARAAMGEIAQYLEPLLDDAVRGLTLHVDDEADAAGVVLEARIAQPSDGPRSDGRVRSLLHGASAWARLRYPLRSAERRERLPGDAGGRSSGRSASCTLSACVESTTVVSVRVTPSSERTAVISSSSEEVFAVFTLSSSVYSPVT